MLNRIAIVATAAAFIGGCVPTHQENVVPQNTTLLVDPAMEVRDWQPVMAYYANGDTVAGPTGFSYRTDPNLPRWAGPLVDAPIFAAQAVALPVNLAVQDPCSRRVYTGATLEPTYTAMPPLPPPAVEVIEEEEPVEPTPTQTTE